MFNVLVEKERWSEIPAELRVGVLYHADVVVLVYGSHALVIKDPLGERRYVTLEEANALIARGQ
jgi:hypothetical protein